jgi:maltose O-acetyltransferase
MRNYFYRRSGVKLPRTSSIHWRAEFYAPAGIVIGENCIIGDSCFLDGREGITFGENVNVGSHVSIYTRQHDVDSPHFDEVGAPVVVGTYAWIASHAVILPGVTIGEGAVVAAGSVVPSDVAPYTLVGGNPARVIRDRNRDLRYRLDYAKRFV